MLTDRYLLNDRIHKDTKHFNGYTTSMLTHSYNSYPGKSTNHVSKQDNTIKQIRSFWSSIMDHVNMEYLNALKIYRGIYFAKHYV